MGQKENFVKYEQIKVRLLKVITRGNVSTFVISFLLAMIFCLLLFSSAWAALTGPLVAATAISVTRAKYMSDLVNRAGTFSGNLLDVVCNGIKIGTIRDSEFAEIKLRVFNHPYTYLAQFNNLCKVILRICTSAIFALPVGVFWFIVAIAIFSPENFNDMLTQLQSPSMISKLFKEYFTFYIVMCLMLKVMLGIRFGLRNQFKFRIGEMVRLHCASAVKGDIVLRQPVNASQMSTYENRHAGENLDINAGF